MKLMLKWPLLLLSLLVIIVANSCNNTLKQNSKSSEKVLVWSDEFDYDGAPDTSKWNYQIGDGCPSLCGWGNNEKQFYTDYSAKNAYVSNGLLIIEARKEPIEKQAYSSAKITTKEKAQWQYARIEVHAKLPKGRGVWPAIWMLPSNKKHGSWPACGEIDIMEHVGYIPDSIFGTVHTSAYNHILSTEVGQSILMDSLDTTFKTYAIDWTPDSISWYIDGTQYHRFKNENLSYKEWPFDQEFYLILNLAVGGNWGGKKGIDDSIWPQRMEIDWVKVWK